MELELIQEMLDMQYNNLLCYSKNVAMTEAKEEYEKEWKETKQKIESLNRIGKIVYSETNSLNEKDENKLAVVMKKILNESASAYIGKTDADMIEIEILNEVGRNVIAKFKIKKMSKCLLFKEYQFY